MLLLDACGQNKWKMSNGDLKGGTKGLYQHLREILDGDTEAE